MKKKILIFILSVIILLGIYFIVNKINESNIEKQALENIEQYYIDVNREGDYLSCILKTYEEYNDYIQKNELNEKVEELFANKFTNEFFDKKSLIVVSDSSSESEGLDGYIKDVCFSHSKTGSIVEHEKLDVTIKQKHEYKHKGYIEANIYRIYFIPTEINGIEEVNKIIELPNGSIYQPNQAIAIGPSLGIMVYNILEYLLPLLIVIYSVISFIAKTISNNKSIEDKEERDKQNKANLKKLLKGIIIAVIIFIIISTIRNLTSYSGNVIL